MLIFLIDTSGSIYCFTSTDCNLTYRIEEVIEYIHKNGPHRHLDKPYLINLIGMKWQMYFSSKKGKEIPIVYEESTIFFKKRMAGSFPGCRGLVEFTRPRDINRHLSKLLEEPISFRECSKGTRDPIWWFRAGSAMEITSFKRLGRRRFLLGWDELVIRKIVAFVDNGRYYSNYVYIEAEGQKPTGLYKYSSLEQMPELNNDFDGKVNEEYAMYKPCVLYHKKITKQEEDDGSTKVLGRLVKMNPIHVETRCRHLNNYNFIIAAKGSAFNNTVFDQSSEYYFQGLLNGSVTMKKFHDYLMAFPKPQRML